MHIYVLRQVKDILKGGKKTRDSIRCLELGTMSYLETMGVGQAETTVYDMVDIFNSSLPSGGKAKGIKKGIIELMT